MHRMQRLAAVLGLSLAATAGAALPDSRADLVRPAATLAYPDIASGVHGSVDYKAATGLLTMTNTPYVFDGASIKSAIVADDSGRLAQNLTLKLDATGNLVNDPGNLYELYGKLTLGDTTYSGLLLSGTPTSFGSQDLGSLGITSDIFDVDIVLNGGLLANIFKSVGNGVYLRFRTDLERPSDPLFAGNFTRDFASFTPTSFLVPIRDVAPIPAGETAVPEPASLLLVLAGGTGLVLRRRLQAAA